MIQFPNICFLTFPTNCNEGWKKKERERGGGKEGWRDEGREFELNYILNWTLLATTRLEVSPVVSHRLAGEVVVVSR